MTSVNQAKVSENSKAARQLAKRMAGEGMRFERQKKQRREGPNVRIRQCKVSGSPFLGYSYVRLRDGKVIGETGK